jgi:hypothetical protein
MISESPAPGMDGIGHESFGADGLAHLEGQPFCIDLRTTAGILRFAQDASPLILLTPSRRCAPSKRPRGNEDFRITPGAVLRVDFIRA